MSPARRTSVDSFMTFVLEQLCADRLVTCRAMFGGYGLYYGTTFFGIIHKGRLFFRTNDVTRRAYLARGMQPFRPHPRQTLKRYLEVPVEVVEDREQLTCWATQAVTLPTAQLALPFTPSA
ncbi:TfoX/Sxy family protein [Nitrospirales bacterium NOB]|nr:MAG: hypothetical protein UZ03_NOB001002613 [Nitrospira sp. OLB3]MBV6471439.1 hypothetical protein [Nitrospirota bacterium]MCE7965608.1 TfoX family protein [Nitrospira sp. NTP2]MCK6492178.1 TfoX/Sxy family protein [Nitrospira sp.]MDL1889174.1 TfoX/Sxy family protein [Nitrospirales bacterium NOB]MEB2339389.1 TfoX/Sxy family protein [Nitrospirales bacterium]